MKNFSWVFFVILGLAVVWIVSKLNPTGNATFTGITNQRGLFGTDQFGNPITPGSGYSGQGIISS